MCRAGNSVSIRYEHMKWHQAAVAIWFDHMKNDQEGERARDARHIYANPFVPVISPILALASYTVTIRFDSSTYLLL